MTSTEIENDAAEDQIGAAERERMARVRRAHRDRGLQGVPSDGMYVIATVEQVAHGYRVIHNYTCEVFTHRITAVREYCNMRSEWVEGDHLAEQIYRLQRVRSES